MKRLLHLSVTTQIFLALVLAIVAGYAMQGCPDVAEAYIKPLGTIFLNLLKFIVVPLVMLSIIAGILSMEDVSKVGRLGIRALLYFSLTTLAAVTLRLGVGQYHVLPCETAASEENFELRKFFSRHNGADVAIERQRAFGTRFVVGILQALVYRIEKHVYMLIVLLGKAIDVFTQPVYVSARIERKHAF